MHVGVGVGVFHREHLRVGQAAADRNSDEVAGGVRAVERERGCGRGARISADVLNKSDVGLRRGNGEGNAVAGFAGDSDDNVARGGACGNRHNNAGKGPTCGSGRYAIECNCACALRPSEV